ncbi:hypothetical protein [Geitlerinema sp. PCC 7407]|uniref:hypothetical protein n=1 Tax=Geitlerinema sp. PCC 7407 TaxID=1173025 RepID=UPI0003146A31|nr:hypothetical protein [Geitlerinema sp. PCC 7407]
MNRFLSSTAIINASVGAVLFALLMSAVLPVHFSVEGLQAKNPGCVPEIHPDCPKS